MSDDKRMNISDEAVEAANHEPVEVAIADGMRDGVICSVCGVVRFGWIETGEWPCDAAGAGE